MGEMNTIMMENISGIRAMTLIQTHTNQLEGLTARFTVIYIYELDLMGR